MSDNFTLPEPTDADARADLVQSMTPDELFAFAAFAATMTPLFFDSVVSQLLVHEVTGVA